MPVAVALHQALSPGAQATRAERLATEAFEGEEAPAAAARRELREKMEHSMAPAWSRRAAVARTSRCLSAGGQPGDLDMEWAAAAALPKTLPGQWAVTASKMVLNLWPTCQRMNEPMTDVCFCESSRGDVISHMIGCVAFRCVLLRFESVLNEEVSIEEEHDPLEHGTVFFGLAAAARGQRLQRGLRRQVRATLAYQAARARGGEPAARQRRRATRQ